MSRFAWMLWLTVSMTALGINMIRYARDGAEVLTFTGGWLVASGIGIPLTGLIITSLAKPGKTKTRR